MKPLRLAALAAVSLSVAVGALAQTPPTPEEAAKRSAHARHAMFETLGTAFGPVGGMLRGRPYDAQAAGLAALRVEVIGGMIKQVTALDTSKFVKDTEARPIIWTERADFEKKADDMVKAAQALKAAAAGTDTAAATKAMQGLGGACKACHDKYRDEDS